MRSTWIAARKADSHDDEEATARHRLERGLGWAQQVFDKLILPATTVSPTESIHGLVFPVLANVAVDDSPPGTDTHGVRCQEGTRHRGASGGAVPTRDAAGGRSSGHHWGSASKASSRITLEAAVKTMEDRATTEVTVGELRAAAMTANDAAEKATTTAAAAVDG